MRRLVMVLAALTVPRSVVAQSTDRDGPSSIPQTTIAVRPGQAALIIAGALLVSGMFDTPLNQGMQAWRTPTTNSFARIGNKFGAGQLLAPALATAWVAGAALGDDGVRRASGHALVAAGAAGLAVTALKWTVGRGRPSNGFDAGQFDAFEFEDSSFPSGHTAMAFSVASSLSRDIRGRWDDVALYGAATLTGLARMNDNKHWLSDVVGGAVIGIFAGKWATRGNRKVAAGPSGVAVRLEF